MSGQPDVMQFRSKLSNYSCLLRDELHTYGARSIPLLAFRREQSAEVADDTEALPSATGGIPLPA